MRNDHARGDAVAIAKKLHQAIGELHRDLQRVEIWAGALSGFAQPVPKYHPSDEFLLNSRRETGAPDEGPEPPCEGPRGRAGQHA